MEKDFIEKTDKMSQLIAKTYNKDAMEAWLDYVDYVGDYIKELKEETFTEMKAHAKTLEDAL